MDQLYNLSLTIHSWSVVAVLVMIFANLFVLIATKELQHYKRRNALYLVPTQFFFFGSVVFSGVVMMAAKHLEFNFANVVMVLLAVVFVVLEIKRLKGLKYLDSSKEHAFLAYKPFGRTILQVEFVLNLAVGLAMWLF